MCRDPTSLNDTELGFPCMAAYGGPVDPNVALGDFGEFCHEVIMIIVKSCQISYCVVLSVA